MRELVERQHGGLSGHDPRCRGLLLNRPPSLRAWEGGPSNPTATR